MNFKRLLAAKGIHYFVTRFGPERLRSIAFDEKYRKGDWDFYAEEPEELRSVVRTHLRQGDLLIMGCGGASILEGLEEDSFSSALGIDLSQEAIQLASRYLTEKISFQQANMLEFVSPQSYDVILFSESLYYVPLSLQEEFLHRILRDLKLGGVVIVTIAQSERYEESIQLIRQNFDIIEDKSFLDSTRHILVFRSLHR